MDPNDPAIDDDFLSRMHLGNRFWLVIIRHSELAAQSAVEMPVCVLQVPSAERAGIRCSIHEDVLAFTCY